MSLSKHESEDHNLNMNYKIVDFTSIFTIPYNYLSTFAEKSGKRLRLNSPHRELLSQEFGNFFARIGLPNEDFIQKKELKEAVEQVDE
ncbi:MAG: hypothetical protein K9L17_08790 [Clostridiales bacterium]|nr:hypothetical protein [Clostridiales bacterium]MCF8022773.1 hypothetical protein [Clostridiales bacterium]